MEYLNERTKDLKQGAIRAMFDKANTMTDVISMGLGEPDMKTPEGVCNAGKEGLDKGFTHYTPNAGLPAARKAVVEKSYVKSIGYDPMTEVIMTNGGMGALSLVMATIIDPGDEVLVQDPQWLNYHAQIRYYGGIPVAVPTKASERFEMKPEVIESLITPRTKVIMINSPNNPTGFTYKRESLEEIAKIAIKHDLLVIVDEVYNTLFYDGAEIWCIAQYPGMKERSIVVNSFSKSYAMTGWRIGFVCGPAIVVDRMTKCQENFNSCANAPGQYAAIHALEHPEYSEGLRKTFEERRAYALKRIQAIKGFKLECIPDGAFYFFPNIEAFGLSDVEFCNRLLDQQRVVCIPGSSFGDCGKGHIRIAYTTGIESLKKAFDRIEVFCDSLRN